jgi:hypothetical protein
MERVSQDREYIELNPTPGFVIKTRFPDNDEKLFVNIVCDAAVPYCDKLLMAQWPIFVLGEFRQTLDRNGHIAAAVDAVVHPDVIRDVMDFRGVEYKDEVTMRNDFNQCLG